MGPTIPQAALLVLFILACVVALTLWATWVTKSGPFQKKPVEDAPAAPQRMLLTLTVYFTDGSAHTWTAIQTDKMRTYMDVRAFRDFVRWLHGRNSDWFGVTASAKEHRVIRRQDIKRYVFRNTPDKES